MTVRYVAVYRCVLTEPGLQVGDTPIGSFALMALLTTRHLAAPIAILTLTACAPSRSAPDTRPEPVPTPVAAVPEPAAPTRVTIAVRHDTMQYDVVNTATIERDSAGTPNREEIVTRARVSFAMERIGTGHVSHARDLRSTGRVDGFVITSSDRIANSRSSALPGVTEVPERPVAPLTVPFDATLNGLTARVAPRPTLANECDQPEMSAMSLVRELLVRMPPELEVSGGWTDTTRSFVCRGGLPITVEHVATSQVLNLVDGPSGPFTRVNISRVVKTRMEGQLTTSWRSVGLTGSGTSVQELLVDAPTGSLVEIESTSVTEMKVHDSVRRDQAEQRVKQVVTMTAKRVM